MTELGGAAVERAGREAGGTHSGDDGVALRARRSGRGEASAALLLQAAGELLAERKSLDISIGDIARRSGLNSALIKYYFGNKDGLLLALVERDAAISINELSSLVNMPISAEKKLKMHIAGVINSYYRAPYLNRLLHYLIGNGEAATGQQIAAFFVKPVIDAQRAILKQGENEGRFRPCDPQLFYFGLIGACDHIFYATYSLRHVLGVDGVSDDLRQRYIAHLTELCMNGILLRPSEGGEA